jgi:hypothetical protein
MLLTRALMVACPFLFDHEVLGLYMLSLGIKPRTVTHSGHPMFLSISTLPPLKGDQVAIRLTATAHASVVCCL